MDAVRTLREEVERGDGVERAASGVLEELEPAGVVRARVAKRRDDGRVRRNAVLQISARLTACARVGRF